MTKQMQVLLAAKALVQAALPLATIAGFDSDFAKPQRVPDNGIVIGHPGEPGDPDVDLSPLAYNYSHRLFLEVAGPDIDGMLGTLGVAIAADPFLGGLCDWFGIEAPDFNDRSTNMIASTSWATVPLVAEYSTNNALA
jgi:hypothetical protein